MAFEALSQILAICQKESIDFAEAVLREDSKDRLVDREASIRQMTAMWESMCDASDSYDVSRKSNSGLVGGAGGVMADYVAADNTLCGDAMGRVIAQALQMGESNACMKRIVAAPTAGACGVLPAVLIPLFRDDPNTIRALFVAAGIGQVIATRASIAGASGGCQAEIGSASAMAAGALADIFRYQRYSFCHNRTDICSFYVCKYRIYLRKMVCRAGAYGPPSSQ